MITNLLNNKKLYWVLFSTISLLFIFTRLFRLDMVPFTPTGMHFDEMSAAYDAWCIQGWGCDRHLTRFPVYFMNTGPGQNALYIYLAAIMFKLVGFSLFKFRLVAVICAAVAFICLFFMSRQLFGKTIFSLIPNALMTVMPVFLMSEHWGLESYLFLSFSIISFYVLIVAICKGRFLFYIIDGILWGLTFYSYGISYVVIPVFLLLTMIYLLYVSPPTIKNILALAIPVLILGFPLAIEQLVINGFIEPFTLFFSDFFPMDITRMGEISFANLPYNFINSFRIIFVEDPLYYNSVPQFGTIYYISIPFMIIGLLSIIRRTVISLKTRHYDALVLILLFYFSGRIVALMTLELNINKANELYFPYMIFTAVGIACIYERFKKSWILPAIVLAYSILFLSFAYWVYSGGDNSWNYQTRPRTEEFLVENIEAGLAVQEVNNIRKNNQLQMIINNVSGRYLQICLFAGTSPYDYNKDGYSENGYTISVPEELDLSGKTFYLIEDDLHHITDYLISEGFSAIPTQHGGFSIVYRQ